MAGKGIKKSAALASKANGRAKSSAASSLAQAPIRRSDRTEASRSRRTHPSADELGLRAWKATYKNSRKNGEA